MGLLDKLKAMLGGNKEQVKSGIDKTSNAAQKVVPDQHDAKVDMAADKAKDVVDGLGSSSPTTPPASTPPSTPPPSTTPPSTTPPSTPPA